MMIMMRNIYIYIRQKRKISPTAEKQEEEKMRSTIHLDFTYL